MAEHDRGGYIAERLLAFKKGFNSLPDVSKFEYNARMNNKVSFSELEFEIHSVGRSLEVKVSPKNKDSWETFRKYFELMGKKEFWDEHSDFKTNYLKNQFGFLQDREYDINEGGKYGKLKAKISTNNKRKVVESLFYSFIVPLSKFEIFFNRNFT